MRAGFAGCAASQRAHQYLFHRGRSPRARANESRGAPPPLLGPQPQNNQDGWGPSPKTIKTVGAPAPKQSRRLGPQPQNNQDGWGPSPETIVASGGNTGLENRPERRGVSARAEGW